MIFDREAPRSQRFLGTTSVRRANVLILIITGLAVLSMGITFINIQRQSGCNNEFRQALSNRSGELYRFQSATHELISGIFALERPPDSSPEFAAYVEESRRLFAEFDNTYADMVRARDNNPLPASKCA